MAAAEIEMVVRRPSFDFEAAARNWMPRNPMLGYQLAAGSLSLPYLEPYLIRVMRQAKLALGDQRPDLQADIDLFSGQEANHFKLHARLNAVLRNRYDGIAEIEAEIEADFARMLREESLGWNLGYAAGFETTGMLISQLFFDDVAESLDGADPAIAGLWGWHLAEEYEHRCVAFDVYYALGGTWRDRVRMYFYQQHHLRSVGERAAKLMREQDRRAGHFIPTPEQTAASKKIEKKQRRAGATRLALALLPWHDPRRHGPLEKADRLLAELDWS
ncbi:MAG: hypothetical protein CL908_19630 [Deltaproteobacteria bacterium]|nr:hypothetical protein [Deltaproteobacteria bacterium]